MTTETRTYTGPDISCDHCKISIESAVAPLPHVESVDVDVAADPSGTRSTFDADQTTGGNTGATEIEVYTAP